ncbi:Alpha/Beta hydrolase fold [Trichophyton rubrum]|nr:Alpha/Beta hydrolase fold [Trichophyton rubrum]
MHIMPSFVLWTFHLCSQWFQGLPDLLPHISDTEPVNNFASQTGLLHPGGMKYFQIAPWVCIPLLTCRGVDATNSADSGSDLQLNESPFSKNWQVLGPFEIGTRESSWGADPLEAYGGFQTLQYDPKASFDSSLALNGLENWSMASTHVNSTADPPETILDINLPPDNLTSLQEVYGWDAKQYQAWARGTLTVSKSNSVVALYTDRIWEYRIDNKSYFGGDFFGFRRAPLLLDLSPGTHTVDLRVVRDVRALGAVGEPYINVTHIAQELSKTLIVDKKSILVADVVENRLISPYASVTLHNTMGNPVDVVGIKEDGTQAASFSLNMLNNHVKLEGAQSRAIGFTIEAKDKTNVPSSVSLYFEYTAPGSSSVQRTQPMTITFTRRKLPEVQQNTFRLPGGVVSYATMRPPTSLECNKNKGAKLPVLLGLHGAGQAASDEIIRTMLDGVSDICAWTLFPSGVTPWSGDDWHTWGFADLQHSVRALNDYIRYSGWTGVGVIDGDWIIAGHSNGGQGTWYTISHYPDKIIAAAPVAGYTSIENYVPYSMWHNTDSLLASTFYRARQDFKHEILVDNFAGIPVYQQHGASDDNVVVYHSRLMHRLLQESGSPSKYHEVPGKNHWYTGIMTSDFLKGFYYTYVQRPNATNLLPQRFSVTLPPAGHMSTRGGIYVDQSHTPDRVGSIEVERGMTNDGVWKLKTRNIRRFHLETSAIRSQVPLYIQVDGSTRFTITPSNSTTTWYTQDGAGKWTSGGDSWRTISQRYGRQAGVNAFLRTEAPFTVTAAAQETRDLALQTCRNLFQYLSADCIISYAVPTADSTTAASRAGNNVNILLGAQPNGYTAGNFAISISARSLDIKTSQGTTSYPFEPGLGAIFIRPLVNERLELVIWGSDIAGLQQVARLVPVLTGVGQPDFVVVNKGTPLKGQGSLYAAGFFDSEWKVSAASYVS